MPLRSEQEILQQYAALPSTVHSEIRDIFRWLLKQSKQDFPNVALLCQRLKGEKPPRITINPTGNQGDVVVAPTDAPAATSNFNPAEFLSENGHSLSCHHFQALTPPKTYTPLPTLEALMHSLESNLYYMDESNVFTIHQALRSGKGLLVTGPPGTGKSALAEQITKALGLDPDQEDHFSTVFCTPDIDETKAIYRWNDAKRLMDLQLINSVLQIRGGQLSDDQFTGVYKQVSNNTYSLRYLEPHKLLQSCLIPYRTVRLIDEADKAPPWFDNELLDLVLHNRCHVPELSHSLGRKKFDPTSSPIFILTSNEEREISQPLSRRCVPIFLAYPPEKLEFKIIRAKTSLDDNDTGTIASFFRKIRETSDLRLRQPPSTSDVLDTAIALVESNLPCTHENIFRMNCMWVKHRADLAVITKRYCNAGQWVKI